MGFAKTIAAGTAGVYPTAKRPAPAAREQPLAVQLEQERAAVAAVAAATRSEDFHAGVSAFLAKKPVTFKGR